MQKLFTLLMVMLLLSTPLQELSAQAPQKMSFQAILRNSNNNLLVNTTVGMRISILEASETGTAVYIETHSVKTNANGLATLAIGTGTVTKGVFADIQWGKNLYYVRTESDPNGGTNYTITSTAQLMSVPYALYAANSGNGNNGKSAFEVWKELPGNERKTVNEFIASLKGEAGQSAFEMWKGLVGNEQKGFDDFIATLKGDKGEKGEDGKSAFDIWKAQPGNEHKSLQDFLLSIATVNGKSAFDVWKEQPGNQQKTIDDYLTYIKGPAGRSPYDIWKELPGNENKTEADYLGSLKGQDGRSAYELWKAIPGNENKAEADYMNAIKGRDGSSAFELWKAIPGNEEKTEADYMNAIKGKDGRSTFELWKDIPGNEGKTEADYMNAIKGKDGRSAFEIWKDIPGNEEKTEADYMNAIRGRSAFELWKEIPGNKEKTEADYMIAIRGKSAYELWKEIPGNEEKTQADYMNAIRGRSAFELWKEIPGNEEKTQADYMIAIRGKSAYELWKDIPGNEEKTQADYMAAMRGKSAYELWKEIPGNEEKTEEDYMTAMKGRDGVSIDFKGTFDTEADYLAAGHEATLNKAYYNRTDKRSYIYDGTTWQIFAQDGGAGSGAGLTFNVDRPITRQGLPVTGLNLGKDKTVEEFLEAFFFPALAATPPQTTFTTTTTTFPYSVWKTWASYSKTVDLNWSVTNMSKSDATDDKDITSIRLLEGSTELATATPNNTTNTQSGVFSNINFANPSGTPTNDFSKTYTLEVKDAQPNTVNKNLTLTMQKAIRLSYGTPTLTPSTLVYEYSPNDIPLTLNWSINRGDETITGIRVEGNLVAGTSNTGTQSVVFRSPANGGSVSQNFSLQASGDLYGWATAQNSATIKWESTLYRGAVSLPGVSPCDAGFNFTDAQVKAMTSKQLGGTWKGDAGYDFVCDAAGQYPAFAYPDDGATPTVQYFDANFNVWQTYPANQVKVIERAGFVNASGYNGINYKIVFVCVEYKSATVKIRIK